MNDISRKFNWVSSLDDTHLSALNELESRMIDFYSNNKNYYSDIDFTSTYWDDDSQLLYKDIQSEIQGYKNILEIGCGSANCLLNRKVDPNKYTGIDFSEKLISNNRLKYPEANFIKVINPYSFPFEDESFDLVFSVFVIEHTVFPHRFLEENLRVLKRNGRLILLCPDFVGSSRLTSQRVGFGPDSGRIKLKRGKILDALITGYDNKIRLAIKMILLRNEIHRSPKFYINLSPTCFFDQFKSDVDAVYLTYEKEIKMFIGKKISWCKLSTAQNKFIRKNRLIYIKGDKQEN